MPGEKDILEENIKKSFTKVKEEISGLKEVLKEDRLVLNKLTSLFEALKDELSSVKAELRKSASKTEDIKNSSTGNKGVYSFIQHSFNIHSLDKTLETVPFIERNVFEMLKTLSKQEFLTLLTIYQLEEESSGPTSYSRISKQLKLSEGCIRTYVSSLLKKGAPILKSRFNNRQNLLSIRQEFRSLNLKNNLLTLFYSLDPSQTTLFDHYPRN